MFFRLSLLGFELFTLTVGRTVDEDGLVHIALPAGYELAEEEEEPIAFGFSGR